jgi:hypothetical protein
MRAFRYSRPTSAVYASSSWKKIFSVETVVKFEAASDKNFSWPLDQMNVRHLH